jgi:Cu/Ag efflux pump CusA
VIARLIEASLRQRFLVLCGTLMLVALGIRAVYRTPVDAIPDLSENQVTVFADWAGRGGVSAALITACQCAFSFCNSSSSTGTP